MRFRVDRFVKASVAGLLLAGFGASPASAYLFWDRPNFTGTPVKGDEPDIGLPLPGATSKEIGAGLVWNMRAGLNVAALQCQFAPTLRTVPHYNAFLTHHARELNDAYQTLNAYFRRTVKSGWQRAFDQYTTRTYNGFSTMHAQLGFCDTAASIGRDVIARPKGTLHLAAQTRMREFRNSLVPVQDGLFARRPYLAARTLPSFEPKCWNRRDIFQPRKCPTPTVGYAQR